MDLDLDDFAAAVQRQHARWRHLGIDSTLHRGPTRDKSAAWVECTAGRHTAMLTVWTSGEAELDLVDDQADAVESTHYDLSTLADLVTCLDHITRRLAQAKPRPPTA